MKNDSRAGSHSARLSACLLTGSYFVSANSWELPGDVNRLADLADRSFVVLFDAGIDDKCRPGDLPCACIEDPSREHHGDAGLLPLSRAGTTKAPRFVSVRSSYVMF